LCKSRLWTSKWSGFCSILNGEEYCHKFGALATQDKRRIEPRCLQDCETLQICRNIERTCRFGGVLTCSLAILHIREEMPNFAAPGYELGKLFKV
jgi:hypothetical protein